VPLRVPAAGRVGDRAQTSKPCLIKTTARAPGAVQGVWSEPQRSLVELRKGAAGHEATGRPFPAHAAIRRGFKRQPAASAGSCCGLRHHVAKATASAASSCPSAHPDLHLAADTAPADGPTAKRCAPSSSSRARHADPTMTTRRTRRATTETIGSTAPAGCGCFPSRSSAPTSKGDDRLPLGPGSAA
jgi:hypothetical protein